MVEAKIRRIDSEQRILFVTTAAGAEMIVRIPEQSVIEVSEPNTMGTMGGTIHDLEEGYLVQLDVEPHQDGSCNCTSLVCIS